MLCIERDIEVFSLVQCHFSESQEVKSFQTMRAVHVCAVWAVFVYDFQRARVACVWAAWFTASAAVYMGVVSGTSLPVCHG